MIIDCDDCRMKDLACRDCVVSVLLGMPTSRAPVELDDAETRAISVLAYSGLVPPLRLLRSEDGSADAAAYDGDHGPGAARAG